MCIRDRDNSDEYGISQIFIAIEVDKLIDGPKLCIRDRLTCLLLALVKWDF